MSMLQRLYLSFTQEDCLSWVISSAIVSNSTVFWRSFRRISIFAWHPSEFGALTSDCNTFGWMCQSVDPYDKIGNAVRAMCFAKIQITTTKMDGIEFSHHVCLAFDRSLAFVWFNANMKCHWNSIKRTWALHHSVFIQNARFRGRLAWKWERNRNAGEINNRIWCSHTMHCRNQQAKRMKITTWIRSISKVNWNAFAAKCSNSTKCKAKIRMLSRKPLDN